MVKSADGKSLDIPLAAAMQNIEIIMLVRVDLDSGVHWILHSTLPLSTLELCAKSLFGAVEEHPLACAIAVAHIPADAVSQVALETVARRTAENFASFGADCPVSARVSSHSRYLVSMYSAAASRPLYLYYTTE